MQQNIPDFSGFKLQQFILAPVWGFDWVVLLSLMVWVGYPHAFSWGETVSSLGLSMLLLSSVAQRVGSRSARANDVRLLGPDPELAW